MRFVVKSAGDDEHAEGVQVAPTVDDLATALPSLAAAARRLGMAVEAIARVQAELLAKLPDPRFVWSCLGGHQGDPVATEL